jgi:OOP family OmpA-OmpF porin
MAKRYKAILVIAVLAMMSSCAVHKKAVTVHEQDVITIDMTVLFDYDKYELREAAKPMLDEIAAKIKGRPEIFVVLEGHTDRRGSAAYNEILAEKRARAVGAYLSQAGVRFDRITFISYGERELKNRENTKAAHGENRRVEIYNH